MKTYVSYSDLARGGPVDYGKVGKVSSESVLKHSGKDWKQWIGLLEKAGAGAWTYQEIVAFLKKKHGLSPWWQHGVALGFEIAVGRRQEGQDAKGKFMVTATKSLPCDAKEAWKLLISEKGQRIWLMPFATIEISPKAQFETTDGYFGEVRTIAPNRRARLQWQDPLWEKHTVVELLLVPKPGRKTLLVFNHTGIAEAKTKELLRTRWRKAADRISGLLTD